MSPYLVGAYAIVWLLPFALLISIWARLRRIEEELEALSAQLAEAERVGGGRNETSEQGTPAPKC